MYGGGKEEEGILIEDDSENQFVWIPTGEYKVSISINSTGELTNELAKRQWVRNANIMQESATIKGDQVSSGKDGNYYYYYYGEGDKRSYTKVTSQLINSLCMGYSIKLYMLNK